jgi:uncharacterized membrane protein YfcA
MLRMSLILCITLVLIGFAVGVVGGMVGIGGGVMVIPILMLGFGFAQARANGTSLAMLLPPIGIFAALAYARTGNVEWRFAALMAVGFAVGAYVGARLVTSGRINPTALRICFALMLVYTAGRILFRPGGRARSAGEAIGLAVAFGLTYLILRILGRRWNRPAFQIGDAYRNRLRETTEYDYEI